MADEFINWDTDYPGYTPPYFVAEKIIKNFSEFHGQGPKGYAEPEDIISLEAKEWRSHDGSVQFDAEGRPLNPRGRTGLSGRGELGKWGANFTSDPVVTKEENGRQYLLVIQRKDNGQWALPGGMVDYGERPVEGVVRELIEEALQGGVTLSEEATAELFEKISAYFSRAEAFYQGHVDDPRNTDNAWMETDAFHAKLTAEEAADLPIGAGDDAAKVRWMELTDENIDSLYASHPSIVKQAIGVRE